MQARSRSGASRVRRHLPASTTTPLRPSSPPHSPTFPPCRSTRPGADPPEKWAGTAGAVALLVEAAVEGAAAGGFGRVVGAGLDGLGALVLSANAAPTTRPPRPPAFDDARAAVQASWDAAARGDLCAVWATLSAWRRHATPLPPGLARAVDVALWGSAALLGVNAPGIASVVWIPADNPGDTRRWKLPPRCRGLPAAVLPRGARPGSAGARDAAAGSTLAARALLAAATRAGAFERLELGGGAGTVVADGRDGGAFASTPSPALELEGSVLMWTGQMLALAVRVE